MLNKRNEKIFSVVVDSLSKQLLPLPLNAALRLECACVAASHDNFSYYRSSLCWSLELPVEINILVSGEVNYLDLMLYNNRLHLNLFSTKSHSEGTKVIKRKTPFFVILSSINLLRLTWQNKSSVSSLAMAATRRLQKELAEIRGSANKSFRDVQVDESNLLIWQGLIVPEKSPYNKVRSDRSRQELYS